MLILVLTEVQYLHNVFFSFEKSSNGQNTTPLRLSPPNKKSPRSLPFDTILKTLPCHVMFTLTNKTIYVQPFIFLRSIK